MYFNAFQDVPPVYELVNLNVRELLLAFNLTHIPASYKSVVLHENEVNLAFRVLQSSQNILIAFWFLLS